MFDRLKSLVFGSKTEEPSVILSECKKPGTLEKWVMWLLSHGVQPKHVVLVLDSTQEDFIRQVSSSDVVEADMNIAWRILSLASQLGSEEITTQLLQKFPPRNRHDMQSFYKGLRETLKNCLIFGGELDKHGVRVRAFGDLEKLPEDIQRLIARVEHRTETNHKLRANMTLGDAAKHDVAVAIADVSKALVQGKLRSEDLTHDFLGRQLMGSMPSPADVYIKTSDVSSLYATLGRSLPIKILTRSFVYNLFIKDRLPDLAFWTYAKALLDFQKNHAILQQRRQRALPRESSMFCNILSEGRKREFEKVRELSRHQELNQLLALERPLLSIQEAPKAAPSAATVPQITAPVAPKHNSLPRRLDAPPSPATQKRFSLNFRSS